MTTSSVPVLGDFVNNVPHALTAVLVQLSPCISLITHIAETLSWRRSWYEGFLGVAFWWAICLLAEPVLRYFLPVLCLLFLPFLRDRPARTTPTTEHTLQAVITDLTTIYSLLPSLPTLTSTTSTSLFRLFIISYVPYLLLTYYLSLRVLLAVSGTLLLTHRAPWSILLRSTLTRSAWIRWFIYRSVSFFTGRPLPFAVFSHSPTSTRTGPRPVPTLRFLFTVYENQRWWMGLDWTAALLPAERPSWSSATQHPVSPPSAFSLPEPTTVFIHDRAGGRVKRTATWAWEEPEWRVLVRKEGGAGASRVERPLPAKEDASPNASRLLKAAGKKRESGILGNLEFDQSDIQSESAEEDNMMTTDADGWVYGDNKWEGLSSKGGISKYTRYRRWTRIAVVSEIVETVKDGEVGIQRTPHHLNPPDSPTTGLSEDQDRENKHSAHSVDSVTVNGITTTPVEEESPLRQRLRRALSKSSTLAS